MTFCGNHLRREIQTSNNHSFHTDRFLAVVHSVSHYMNRSIIFEHTFICTPSLASRELAEHPEDIIHVILLPLAFLYFLRLLLLPQRHLRIASALAYLLDLL